MSESLGRKLGALSGLVYAFCAFMGMGALLGESSPDDKAETHLKLLSDTDAINGGVLFTILAVGALLYFASTMRWLLASAEPVPSRLSSLWMTGIGAAAASLLVGPGLLRALVVRLENDHEVNAEIAGTAFAFAGTMSFLAGIFIGGAAIAAAAVILRYKAMPSWFGWASLVLGLVMVVGAVGSPMEHVLGFAATATSFLYFALAAVAAFLQLRRVDA